MHRSTQSSERLDYPTWRGQSIAPDRQRLEKLRKKNATQHNELRLHFFPLERLAKKYNAPVRNCTRRAPVWTTNGRCTIGQCRRNSQPDKEKKLSGNPPRLPFPNLRVTLARPCCELIYQLETKYARSARRRVGRDQRLGPPALYPEERRRRLQLHLPGVAEPVARHRAADLQTPAAVPRRSRPSSNGLASPCQPRPRPDCQPNPSRPCRRSCWPKPGRRMPTSPAGG